ncbi:hypothetical protein BDN72DRAFT_841188 [Pluteus cervinus]|uniref:Uncharacterized protein n=1 Tax=Pluteus cervinus TaxID=181527 RepID=A0ACD3ASR0_9AGAR|nr:hypothetical protein BDN72DRAFT_841188 [Pluteus cervinus]
MDLLYTAKERKEIINGARKGSVKQLATLAKLWPTLPNALSDGIHSIFFHHLNSSDVPTEPEKDIDLEDVDGSTALDTVRAFWSLWGIGLSGRLPSLSTDPYGHEFVRAWPGIFKWSAFLFTSRVQISSADFGTKTASSKRLASMCGITRDVIAGCWCALVLSPSAKKAVLTTRGAVDIAARLWIFEDDSEVIRTTPCCEGIPIGSLLMDHLSNGGDEATMNRIISAAGGDLDRIAKISLGRLKKALNSPEFVEDPLDATLTFNLVVRFCRTPSICETFLKNGAIPICT